MSVVSKLKTLELPYVERVVVVREQGSIEFTPEELAADIVFVDVKCTALAGTVYTNKRSLPDYGFYGYVSLFGGATVKEKIPLDFVYQRVIDFEQTYRRLYCYLTLLERKLADIEAFLDSPNNVPPVGPAELPQEFEYRGLPYSKLKIKSVVAAQWNVTVRRYLQVTEFNCQSVSKSDDPTKGEDENPSPLPIPNPDSYPAGLPLPTVPYPGADPDDFPDGAVFEYERRPVYIGFRTTLTSGQVGAINACTGDTPYSTNELWEDAGRPPYTFVRGDGVPPNCTNARWGFHAQDADGGRSPLYAYAAGCIEGEIVVWSYEPIGS